MGLTLNHYSVRTTDLDATRYFYESVLGLTVGPRPDFPFPGLWMYQGDPGTMSNAVVHVIGIDGDDTAGLRNDRGERKPASLKGSGALDHVAFAATGLPEMLARLQRLGITARRRTVPSVGSNQLFLDDPNGLVVELNYPANESTTPAA